MANDVSNFKIPYYTKALQLLLSRRLVAMKLASREINGNLVKGDTFHKPTPDDVLYAQDYTKYTDSTVQDITTTDESGTIDQSKIVTFALDDVDRMQKGYDTETVFAGRAAHALAREIDGKWLDEVTNASYNVAAGAIAASTCVGLIQDAKVELYQNDVEDDVQWGGVFSPKVVGVIGETFVGSGFQKADTTLTNGYLGNSPALGLNVYMSNNLKHTVSLALATNPTADDTVTIKGVTFTFKAVPSSAGEVDIGANAAASVDNLVAAINGTGTPGATTYIELSAANRAKLKLNRVVATDNTTSIGLTASGTMSPSSSLTDASDKFGAETCHNAIGRPGWSHLVLQKTPRAETRKEPLKLVDNILTHTLYGVKTFTGGANRFLDFQTTATAAES